MRPKAKVSASARVMASRYTGVLAGSRPRLLAHAVSVPDGGEIREPIQPKIKDQKPHFRCNLYHECGLLYLSLQCNGCGNMCNRNAFNAAVPAVVKESRDDALAENDHGQTPACPSSVPRMTMVKHQLALAQNHTLQGKENGRYQTHRHNHTSKYTPKSKTRNRNLSTSCTKNAVSCI
eukprot:1596085-Rhodomonas_salina.3